MAGSRHQVIGPGMANMTTLLKFVALRARQTVIASSPSNQSLSLIKYFVVKLPFSTPISRSKEDELSAVLFIELSEKMKFS